ncbi:Protein Wnt-10a [Halocaridina rubra]|uniref:Protein Wnt n=1 Tax=Halocaridina rubra TaxID=373956 RepID=A0AAN8XEP5_HALRR
MGFSRSQRRHKSTHTIHGNEDLNVQLPPGYPSKFSKSLSASFQGYPSRYRGYPADWGGSRYPYQQFGYQGSSNEYSGTDNRYPEEDNEYPANKNMYPGNNNAFVSNVLNRDQSMPHSGYPQNDVDDEFAYSPNGMGYPGYGGYPVIPSSPNDVINGRIVSPWDAAIWDHPLDPDVCRNLAGLTRPQVHICTRNTDLAGAAAIGLALAVRECKRQFAHHRWNCTALKTPSNNPHTAPIMTRGKNIKVLSP